MTTATTTATEQLEKLNAKLTQERTKLLKIRRDRDAYTAETDALSVEYTGHSHDYPEEVDKHGNPIDGTRTAKLKAELTARQAGLPREKRPNPHTADYKQQRDKTNQLADQIEEFRLRHADTLIGEIEPPAEQIAERLEAAWTEINTLIDMFRTNQDQAKELIGDTPGLNGQHVASDARINGWADVAADALANPLFIPRVSDMGRYEIDRQIDYREANNA